MAADRIHLLADDLADLLVHTPAQREHGVVAGLELAHEAATDQQAVAGRLGLPADLPRSNDSSHRDYREYYDDESRELVTRWVRADLEAFDYRFSD